APFFTVLGELVERCDTAREERWLRELLAGDESQLADLSAHCRLAIDAPGVQARGDAIRQVNRTLQQLTGRPTESWMLRAAMRSFGRQLLVPRPDGTSDAIAEWRLYREINVVFL